MSKARETDWGVQDKLKRAENEALARDRGMDEQIDGSNVGDDAEVQNNIQKDSNAGIMMNM